MRLSGKRATPQTALITPAVPAARWTLGRIAFFVALAFAAMYGVHAAWDYCVNVQAPGLLTGTTVTVESKSVGRIVRLDVSETQPVRAGQPILWIDDVDLTQQVERQRGQVQLLDTQLDTERHRVQADVERSLARVDSDLDDVASDLCTLDTRRSVVVARKEGVDRELAALRSRIEEQRDLVALGSLARASLSKSELEAEGTTAAFESLANEQAGIEKAMAAVEQRRQALVARRDLVADQIRTASQIESLATQLRAAREELQRLEARRGEYVLHAPVTGVVQRICKRAGEVALTGETLIEIADSSVLHVEAYFSQPDLVYCTVGTEVSIQFGTGHRRRGRISELKPITEPLPHEYRNQFEARRGNIVAIIRPIGPEAWPDQLLLHADVRTARYRHDPAPTPPSAPATTRIAVREVPMHGVRR
jgi:HlyD family secretion protein